MGGTIRGTQIISTRPKDRKRETIRDIIIIFLMIISIAVAIRTLYQIDRINNIDQRLYKVEEDIPKLYNETKNLQKHIKEFQKDKRDTSDSK